MVIDRRHLTQNHIYTKHTMETSQTALRCYKRISHSGKQILTIIIRNQA